MAVVLFPNALGLPAFPFWPYSTGFLPTSSIADAVGESTAFIGRILMPGGPGTSKVISGAGGGTIEWYSVATSTFANAGTTVRVGVQDVDANGIEDGTFDVSGDLTGGGGGIANGGFNTTAMGTGTKTVAWGDAIAVVVEVIARAGVDSIRPGRGNLTAAAFNSVAPYCSADVGAGPVKNSDVPMVVLHFDDGTIGYLGDYCLPVEQAAISFNSGSTPDEYALLFQVPMDCRVTGLLLNVTDLDSGETGEVILYSDPLGTPVAERTEALGFPQTGHAGATAGIAQVPLTTTYDLLANTDYAVAYRPTTTGNRSLYRWTIGSATARAALPLGTTLRGGTRTDQTGAFGSISTTVLPQMGILIGGVDITSVTTVNGTSRARVQRGM